MLLLTSTSDVLRVVTTTTAPISVHASWVDNATGVITPGRTNTAISTATTTTVTASPAASTQRNVQTLMARNTHASSSNTVSVEHFDGTTAASMFSATLAAGECLMFVDGQGFQVITASGAIKTSQNQGVNATSSSISTVVLSADVTNANATANTMADVTALSFPVTSGNTFWFRFCINYTSAATTTGSRWAVNGPTFTALSYRSTYALTTTTETVNHGLGAYDLPAASNASSAATGANVSVIEGFITPSANGTVIARFASEITVSAIVAKAGSTVQYQQVI